jgi:agmatine deiminase
VTPKNGGLSGQISNESQLSGYRMPPEWGPHYSTILAFPQHRTDWPRKLSVLPHVFAEMARVLSDAEKVRLLVSGPRQRERASRIFEAAGVRLDRVEFLLSKTNRSWTRDSMPIWVSKSRVFSRLRQPVESASRTDSVAVKFCFDGWSRYRDHQLDDAAGVYVAKKCARRFYFPATPSGRRVVLEGGSIDVDASGTLLSTLECLVTSKRARFKGGQVEAEETLQRTLGVKKVVWLPSGIVGDDTSGHVDDFARFAPQNRILLCEETRKGDANYVPLRAAKAALRGATNAQGAALETVPLPMPQAVFYEGERLPASYANFYVANAAVLVPVFNDPNDRIALSIIADCFPDRPAVGIYARDLVVGLGTLHCSTMQEPL